MLSVDEALSAILKDIEPLSGEMTAVGDVAGRRAASDVIAAITQPPFAASAMDGYAVRFADVAPGARLKVIGEAPAGTPLAAAVGAGEAVRIFTGGVVPKGADHIVIQENADRQGDEIIIEATDDRPRHIRAAGLDFKKGDVLASAGEVLHEIHSAIFATANLSAVSLRKKPVVAIFSNGDELRAPGSSLGPGEIVNSNHYAIAALVEGWGGEARYLGCAKDSVDAVGALFERAISIGADIIVPVGGASVGDYDFVKEAFERAGGALSFQKVAVRPGKPTWFGAMGMARVLGLPGNPASAIVTAALFLQPLVRAMLGACGAVNVSSARCEAALPANGPREHYMRAIVRRDDHGVSIAPVPNQDSAMLTPFARANALLRRAANAPAVVVGDPVDFVPLRPF